MKVKKYTANSMHEAMKHIRAELGDDAVILSSKEVESGGFLGFFTKKKTEVVAAIDSMPERPQPVRTSKPKVRINEEASPSLQPKEDQKRLLKEVEELKALVQGMSTTQTREEQQYPAPFQQLDDQLKAHGVIESIRLEVIKNLLKEWYNKTESGHQSFQFKERTKQLLVKELSLLPMGDDLLNKKVVNIVGPTGVGKTTTIAKIAAEFVLKKHKKVALITTDTYRIAAVEQLKTYAKILNIPIEVAYSVEDFKKAKEQFQHYDVLLVDSAGRNFRNKLYVEELSKVIDFNQEAETLLVLALTSKYEDMKQIIGQFSLIPIKQVIFTKQDETSSYGACINVPFEFGLGVAYVTNGQNVPDDMIEATAERLIQPILKGVHDE
ncbi:flagellar biosynthesis protein FlhF [Bacillus sp. FJAT-45037]|uniref:flagellar biosynthesis protein FlhF n=1 Tax=Bacillus sp. FJAT-45037 TaxID=2011007 RepID=UPI000C24290B|nr:flagellar biosynthesis protein FlhF [Bacillus sp. FJAT-45037]